MRIVLSALLVLAAGCGKGDEPAKTPGQPQESKPVKTEEQKSFKYVCPMDGGERETPGPCPKCGMTLDERHKKTK